MTDDHAPDDPRSLRRPPRPIEQFEAMFNPDDPYNHDKTVQAAQILAACTRYLVYVASRESALPYAQTVGIVADNLHTSLGHADEMLARLTHRFRQLVLIPGAYVDNVGAATTLDEVEARFTGAARAAREQISGATPYVAAAARAANRISMG